MSFQLCVLKHIFKNIQSPVRWQHNMFYDSIPWLEPTFLFLISKWGSPTFLIWVMFWILLWTFMPDQVWTFLTVYLEKKKRGQFLSTALRKEIYFNGWHFELFSSYSLNRSTHVLIWNNYFFIACLPGLKYLKEKHRFRNQKIHVNFDLWEVWTSIELEVSYVITHHLFEYYRLLLFFVIVK